MHPLHDYIARQLAERLRARGCRGLVRPAPRVRAVRRRAARRGAASRSGPSTSRSVSCRRALVEYAGSMFELRAVVEPLVAGERPEPVRRLRAGRARGTRRVGADGAGEGRRPVRAAAQAAREERPAPAVHRRRDRRAARPRRVTYEDLAALRRSPAARAALDPQGHLPRRRRQRRDARGMAGQRRPRRGDRGKDAARELVKLVESRSGSSSIAADASRSCAPIACGTCSAASSAAT